MNNPHMSGNGVHSGDSCTPRQSGPTLSAPIEPSAEQEILALMLHHGREFFRASEMKQFFAGSREIFHECRDAHWLACRHQGNRFSGYHLSDIVQCLRRLRREGRPPQSANHGKNKAKRIEHE